MLEHDHVRLRRKLESVLGELNSIPAGQDQGDVYLEKATEIVIEIENEAVACLNSWTEFTSSKDGDLKYRDSAIDGLEKLVNDIQVWFASNKYTNIETIDNALCFDRARGGWEIKFDGKDLFIKNKSGLLQLANLLMNPGRQLDLKGLSDNVLRPNSIIHVDKNTKDELAGMAKDRVGGISIDAAKCNKIGTEVESKNIAEVYEETSEQINIIEHSDQDYENKHIEIENILDIFARYIGKTSVSLKAFKGEHFLRNILRENNKKTIRANNPSIASAKAAEKSIRRCIVTLKSAIPALGNYFSNNIEFKAGSVTYINSDSRLWKITF